MSLTATEFGYAGRTLNYVWDVNTLQPVLMQQPVIEGGTIVVGTVDQGAAGAIPWLVDGSGVTQPVSGPLTYAQFTTGQALQFDGSASPVLYLGAAPAGSNVASAVWQITRFDTTSGVAGQFPNGSAAFNQVWNDRASLSYS